MGYRSSVKACVYGEAEKVELYIVKHKMECADKTVFKLFNELNGVEDADPPIKIIEKEMIDWHAEHVEGQKRKTIMYKIVDLEEDDVKWYDDYEDVKAWHKFMEEAEEFGLQYEFVRVGESTDDVQTEQSVDNAGFVYPTVDITCEY